MTNRAGIFFNLKNFKDCLEIIKQAEFSMSVLMAVDQARDPTRNNLQGPVCLGKAG